MIERAGSNARLTARTDYGLLAAKMKLRNDPPVHLTYCLNVHPGERWTENLAAIREKALKVRDLVGWPGPFGLGLRLSRLAAEELSKEANLKEFQIFLRQNDLYVFTVNGFPYGPFHDTAVKQDVYAPDWRTQERRDYTILLAKILSRLLPEGVPGSISTVPGSYKAWIKSQEDVRQMATILADAAVVLHNLAREGHSITLALEPEPDCFIENTQEAVDFLTGPTREYAIAYLQRTYNAPERAAEETWGLIGVCLDTAHAAVQFEEPVESLKKLNNAGVRVGKVHLSSALCLRTTPRALEKLAEFAEGVYLHQVKVRGADGRTLSYEDLPQALRDAPAAAGEGAEWRVHFHVPLFFDEYEGLRSTSSLLGREFFQALRGGATEHLEIETYTFGVLPEALRRLDVTESIAREYQWVLGNWSAAQERR